MKELVRRHPALCFSVFIVVWTWIFMAVVIAFVPIDPVEGPQFVHVALVFFVASPTVFAFVFTRMIDGKEGVRALLVRARRWRVNPIWYAASLLLIPAVIGLSALIQSLLGADLATLDLLGNLAFAVPISLLAAVMEEFGWRGLMLPRLLKRYSALKAALIVGVVWALWHAPINYLGLSKYGARAVPILAVLLVLPIAQTVIMTWIHNSAKQSMLMMILTHFSITAGFIIFALPHSTAASELRGNLITAGMLTLAAIVVVLACWCEAADADETGGVRRMKAIVFERYGPPEALSLREVEKPVVRPDEILVKVRAAGVNPQDWHCLRGTPFLARLFVGGFRRSGHPILGSDIAGTVEDGHARGKVVIEVQTRKEGQHAGRIGHGELSKGEDDRHAPRSRH